MRRRKAQPVTLEWMLSRTVAHGECRLWLGASDRWGYGTVKCNGRTFRAHRVALGLSLGRELLPSEPVLHSCDRAACIAPTHLSVGTIAQNNWQRVSRLTVNPRPKPVSAAMVASMRALAAKGATCAEIARSVGVSIRTVRVHWRWSTCDAQIEIPYAD